MENPRDKLLGITPERRRRIDESRARYVKGEINGAEVDRVFARNSDPGKVAAFKRRPRP